MKFQEVISFQEKQVLQSQNINYSQFKEVAPIAERTFAIFKEVYGSEPLLYFFRILGSDLPLGKKKRMFYDYYQEFSENRKDLIWENYISWNILKDEYDEEDLEDLEDYL